MDKQYKSIQLLSVFNDPYPYKGRICAERCHCGTNALLSVLGLDVQSCSPPLAQLATVPVVPREPCQYASAPQGPPPPLLMGMTAITMMRSLI